MKNSEIILLVDVDDTIIDTVPAWCDWLNRKYKLNVNSQHILDWDIASYYRYFGLSKKQVFAPLYKPRFWRTVTPKQDADKYLRWLNCETKLYLCTDSNLGTIKSKMEYVIDRYFSFLNWRQVIITPDKSLINGDILIDDKPDNLIDGAYKKILMTAPHNKDYATLHHGMCRVNNWAEAYKAIRKIIELLQHGGTN